MPTTFIAVQCFQCSTMQVKQQKKSSNKWSCVVCGEKQSLRKVFAQGFMAKDVRGFVQRFNMSRQLQEDSLPHSPIIEKKNESNRRTDWTEYIDDGSEECSEKLDIAHGDGELEPMIVTEMPKALFKKPKFKGNYVSGSQFSSRNDMPLTDIQNTAGKRAPKRSYQTMKNQEVCSDEEHSESDRALKWNWLRAQIQQGKHESSANTMPWTSQSTKIAGQSVSKWEVYSARNENDVPQTRLHQARAAKGPASKWSSFITEDDDGELQTRGRRDSLDHVGLAYIDGLETLMNDERVEDDIHPDFF